MNNINNLKLSVNKRIIKVDLVNEIIQKSSISSKRRVVITISGIANLRERERERANLPRSNLELLFDDTG